MEATDAKVMHSLIWGVVLIVGLIAGAIAWNDAAVNRAAFQHGLRPVSSTYSGYRPMAEGDR